MLLLRTLEVICFIKLKNLQFAAQLEDQGELRFQNLKYKPLMKNNSKGVAAFAMGLNQGFLPLSDPLYTFRRTSQEGGPKMQ